MKRIYFNVEVFLIDIGGLKPKCPGQLSAMVKCEGVNGDTTGES